jgi:hypothetical protein
MHSLGNPVSVGDISTSTVGTARCSGSEGLVDLQYLQGFMDGMAYSNQSWEANTLSPYAFGPMENGGEATTTEQESTLARRQL